METRISNTGKEYVIDTADIQATAVPTNAGPDFHTNSWGKPYGIATMLGNSATPLSPGGGLLKINGHTDLTELMGKDKTKGYIQKVYLEYSVGAIVAGFCASFLIPELPGLQVSPVQHVNGFQESS